MSTLLITRGLPGCGKTTYARNWVAADPLTRSRSNRDDLGLLMHGRRFYGDDTLYGPTEDAITIAQHAQIAALLAAGRDVICDDTNLAADRLERLAQIGRDAGAVICIESMLDVPLDVVLERNAQRAGTPAFVPETVVRDMWDRYVAERDVSPL